MPDKFISIKFQQFYFPASLLKNILVGTCLMGVFFFTSCGVHQYDNREGTIATNIRIDSLQFVPQGTRFILADSSTAIRFKGIHLGFLCSEILKLGFDSTFDLNTLVLTPISQIRLPAEPSCAIDTTQHRDSIFKLIFKEGNKPISVVLQNSSNSVTASATILRGKIFTDSIDTVLSPTNNSLTIKSGKDSIFFQDTLGVLKRQLIAKTVSSCLFLHQATLVKKDSMSTKVRYSWILKDSTLAQNKCHEKHNDTIAVSSTLK